MDYLDEYLSLVQSFKAYRAPKVELSLKVQQMLQEDKESIEKPAPLPRAPAIPSIKESEARIDKGSNYPLNLPKTPLALDNALHTAIKKALPRQIFYEYPPIGISPTKKLPSCNLPNVPLFFYGETHFDRTVLTNLLSAIQDKFALSSAFIDVREIEEDNLWRSVISMAHLTCIMVFDTWINTCPHGRCWYRVQPNTNNCFLGTIPLIVLSSKADWYRDIDNKKVLWNQLCQILKQPSRKTIVQ